MRAVCRSNRSSDLADHQQGRFPDTSWEGVITIGTSYVVLGMGIWESVLQLLIRSDHGLPTWAPVGLFDVTNERLPPDWRFATREGLGLSGRELWTRWVCQWGYAELINNEQHSDMLQERDPAALAVFSVEYGKAEAEQDSS